MNIHRDIPYLAAHSSTKGDLFLPGGGGTGSPVLLIHGGGWTSLDKESFEFMTGFFVAHGHPVFNINYRLLGEAVWPACAEDCTMAGRFILDGSLSSLGVAAPAGLIVCGASAGGHLAMMTGLMLPRDRVRGILSMAGPSRLDWIAAHQDPLAMHEGFLGRFFGREVSADDKAVQAASPALCLPGPPPPLFCFHSSNDDLVPLSHSQTAVEKWQEAGGCAELTIIDGIGNLHGFWMDSDRSPGVLRPEVSAWVSHCLARLP